MLEDIAIGAGGFASIPGPVRSDVSSQLFCPGTQPLKRIDFLHLYPPITRKRRRRYA